MATKPNVRKAVREIISRFKGFKIAADDIEGNMDLSKGVLGFSIHKFKGMKEDLNEGVLENVAITIPTGPKGPRMTFKKLEELHKKQVRDLEEEMHKLALAVETANP